MQKFLIVPVNSDIIALEKIFKEKNISAVLLLRGIDNEKTYEKYIRKILPLTQKYQIACLLDNCPNLAKKIGADGVHMSTDIKNLREAVRDLKPDMIVGAGNINSKDDAMKKGEAKVDYVFFGDLNGEKTSQETYDLASWWAKTFEVPAVFYDPQNKAENTGCEFSASYFDLN